MPMLCQTFSKLLQHHAEPDASVLHHVFSKIDGFGVAADFTCEIIPLSVL